jgi:hypothetical protein
VLLAFSAARPALAASNQPDDLGQWGLHCFCLTARHTPQRVIRMDGNARVLSHAVGGATLGELRASGLTVTDSQVLLPRTYGLIDHRHELPGHRPRDHGPAPRTPAKACGGDGA